MKLSYTRAMIHAALEGELNTVETKKEEIFGLHMPIHIAGVPDEVLFPRDTWEDKAEYDKTAQELAQKFHENFKKFSHATEEIKQAGPQFKQPYQPTGQTTTRLYLRCTRYVHIIE